MYCVLRVETDGLYLLSDKVRLHSERKAMPPKHQGVSSATETSAEYYARSQDPDLLEKLFLVLDDLQETFRLDPKALAMLRPAYKKAGNEFSIKFRESWTSYAGLSILEALVQYYHEVLDENQPPPTPLRKGERA